MAVSYQPLSNVRSLRGVNQSKAMRLQGIYPEVLFLIGFWECTICLLREITFKKKTSGIKVKLKKAVYLVGLGS